MQHAVADIPLTFAEITEAARMFNETVLGLRTASGKITLGSLPSDVFMLHPQDKVVTFAADFVVTKV